MQRKYQAETPPEYRETTIPARSCGLFLFSQRKEANPKPCQPEQERKEPNMHIRFDRQRALDALKRLTPVLPKSNLLPALRDILLEAQEGSPEVTAVAQNTMLRAKVTLGADVLEGGSLLFDGTLLTKIIEHFGAPVAEIKTTDCDGVLLASGATRYLLSAQDAAGYPAPLFPEPEDCIEIVNFPKLARACLFAVGRGTKKIEYNCVKLDAEDSRISLSASDLVGYMRTSMPVKVDTPLHILIPAEIVSYIAGVLGAKETLRIGTDGAQVVFKAPSFCAALRSVPGAFLDADQVLRRVKPGYMALANAQEFARMLSMLASAAVPESTVALKICDEHIKLRADGLSGRCRTEVEAQATIAMPDAKNYALNRLLPALQRFGDGSVKIIVDASGVLVLQNEHQTYLLSPTRAFDAQRAREKERNRRTKKAA